jgi:hypothetical protein
MEWVKNSSKALSRWSQMRFVAQRLDSVQRLNEFNPFKASDRWSQMRFVAQRLDAVQRLNEFEMPCRGSPTHRNAGR